MWRYFLGCSTQTRVEKAQKKIKGIESAEEDKRKEF